MLSAHSVESSRNCVIALPTQKNFVSALLSAKVWHGVLELSVILEAYMCIVLSYKEHVAACNIAEIIIFNVSQLVFLYRMTTFYLHACIVSTSKTEGCVLQDKVFIIV